MSTKNDIKILPPFKMQVLTNFPYIEADFDAITNYQLLCKVVEYLNMVISNENELTKAYQYILDYFNNLDVQEEINNKLDEMAESGQLTDIIAQYLGLAGMITYNNVSEMKAAENIVNGSKCQTLGYNNVNDGGGATYKIRTITNDDVVDEATIIALHDDTLIAELIFEDKINPKQFGCYGDGTHDDTINFHKAIDCSISKKLPLCVIGNYLLTSAYQLTEASTTLTIYGHATGNSFAPEHVGGSISRIYLYNNIPFISGSTYTTTNSDYPKMCINMQDINFYSNEIGEKYIFENIYVHGSIIKNNTAKYIGLIKGTIAVNTVVDSNKLTSITCFMDRGTVSARELFSDSVICNNYISGLNGGYCFKNPVCGNMRITDNYIDFFKTIYGNANMGGTILSQGNIYDGYCYIFEGSDTVPMGQFTSINDKYFTHTKARCIELGYITNDNVKTSFNIKALNYNIEIINPKIRYDANNTCDEAFIYGSLSSPTLNLKIALINPSYTSGDGSAIGNVRLNINNLINVKMVGSSAAQVFANSGISYQPARIDTLAEAPERIRDSAYILPPRYTYFNTTDNKTYQFSINGQFVEI